MSPLVRPNRERSIIILGCTPNRVNSSYLEVDEGTEEVGSMRDSTLNDSGPLTLTIYVRGAVPR
jgi:hypothetical protein